MRSVIKWSSNEFDEELSSFRAEALVDFMLRQIGPSQYNQAITDPRKFMLEKLDDLDSEFFRDRRLAVRSGSGNLYSCPKRIFGL